MKQIIICVEAGIKSKSDYMYIEKCIDDLYVLNNDIKITAVYLGTKTKYDEKEKEINKNKKYITDTTVVFCIDTDNIFLNKEDIDRNTKIKKYCEDKGYELVWFCQTIENVFLDKKISSHEKVAQAKRFVRNKNVISLNDFNLSSKDCHNKCSNLLLIMDKLLERKS